LVGGEGTFLLSRGKKQEKKTFLLGFVYVLGAFSGRRGCGTRGCRKGRRGVNLLLFRLRDKRPTSKKRGNDVPLFFLYTDSRTTVRAVLFPQKNVLSKRGWRPRFTSAWERAGPGTRKPRMEKKKKKRTNTTTHQTKGADRRRKPSRRRYCQKRVGQLKNG